MIFNNYEEVFVMDYSQEYKQKLVSADEAVKLIKSGDWVDFGWCTNTVDALDQALAKREPARWYPFKTVSYFRTRRCR